MSAEDRLREVLRREATTVVPAGDGLAKIQQRLVRRRRRRAFLLPACALATAGAVTAFFVLGGTGEWQKLVQTPTTHGPTPSSCHPGLPEGPCPTATPQPTAPPAGSDFSTTPPMLWPFTSDNEARSWERSPGPRTWASDPDQVTRHFVQDFLGITGASTTLVSGDCIDCPSQHRPTTVIGVTVGGRRVAAVQLAQVSDAKGPWTVTGVLGADLTITSPRPGAAVSSPLSVTGRITGVDENVRLRLITATGKEIATAGAPAGSAVPWQGTLAWADPSWTTAGIVGTTYSLKDGSLTRVVVQPVRQATGSSAGAASFVGVDGGLVNLYDSHDGTRLRQLTFPPAGKHDTGAAWSNGTLAWVRSQQTGCSDGLYLSAAGTVATVVAPGTAHLGTPQLSPDGGLLAWVESPCFGGALTLVVQGGGSPDRHILLGNTRAGSHWALQDVRGDGTALLTDGSGLIKRAALLPPGATTLQQAVYPAGTGSCQVRGGAFDGQQLALWEQCAAGIRLATFTAQGIRIGAGPFVAGLTYPEITTIRGGRVLLRQGAGEIDRYASGRLTAVLINRGCRAAGPASCVQGPDW
jgi:hypothetical protein